MRNVWIRPAIRARNGTAIMANSTAVAPLLSLMKTPKRPRRLVPAVGFISAMALLSLCEARGAGRDLDEQVRQRLRDITAGLNIGEEAGRGAGLQILCDRAG